MTDKDAQIGLSDLQALRRAGLLPAERYVEAASLVRDARFWSDWMLKALLAFGAGHLLAGIVFFFAFNWADMPSFWKFAVIEGGIVIAVAGAFVSGLDRPVGEVLLIAATVLTGVLLAVFGQVYQTGADAFELFVSWAFITLPWVLISRSAPHWLVWLIVACAALGLYCEQILKPQGLLADGDTFAVIGALIAIALAAREAAVARGLPWLGASWVRYTLLFAGLCAFFIAALTYVLGWNGSLLTVAAFAASAIGAFLLYRTALPDFVGFALPTGFAAFFLMALGGRFIAETIGFAEDDYSLLSAFALLTIWCVAVTAALARIIVALRRGFPEERA